MVWKSEGLSSFLCWFMQRTLLPSREAVPVAAHSMVLCLSLCKAFPSPHMESPVERELSQGGQTNFSHSPSSLLPFLSPQLLTAALPREGKDLSGCRDYFSPACDALPTPSLQPLCPTPASP